MNKKKAVICTILFTIVLAGAIVGAMFAKSNFGFSLYDIVSDAVFFLWIANKINVFYNWLQEE